MAKNPGKGRCVHCLQEGVERNWDHVFPQSWYPDTTAADMEKWQIPSCVVCNDRYGKLERDLIGRLGLALDSSNAASAGLAEKALRAINPDAANSEGDAAARDARAKKILRETYKGEELKGKNVVPGLGERWDRPLEEQLGISIPEGSLPAMTEKIVRGITFREDGACIEPDREIKCFLVKDEDVKDVKEMLDKAGKMFKREPGLVVRRARSAGGDLYEITFWNQFKTYATVSKQQPPPALSSRQRRALRRARLNAWLQQRADEYARSNDPFANLGKLQISVEVSSVIRASPTSFRVAWIQRAYENGSLSATERWTAILTVVIDTPRDADRLRKNPLDVYVNAINWSKEF